MVRGSIRGAKESPHPPLFRTAALNRSWKKYTSGNNLASTRRMKKKWRRHEAHGKVGEKEIAEKMRREKRIHSAVKESNHSGNTCLLPFSPEFLQNKSASTMTSGHKLGDKSHGIGERVPLFPRQCRRGSLSPSTLYARLKNLSLGQSACTTELLSLENYFLSAER